MEKKVSGKHSSMNGFAMMKGRVVTVVLASALLLGGGLTAQAQNAALTTCLKVVVHPGETHPLLAHCAVCHYRMSVVGVACL